MVVRGRHHQGGNRGREAAADALWFGTLTVIHVLESSRSVINVSNTSKLFMNVKYIIVLLMRHVHSWGEFFRKLNACLQISFG